MVTKWLLSVHPCRCVGVNNDDFLDILRNVSTEERTEETTTTILVWLQNYWYIPVGIIVVITIVVIVVVILVLSFITYRKKSLSKLRERVNSLQMRASQRGSQRNRGQNIQEVPSLQIL